MGYRIPSDERLLEAIETSLQRHPMADSQRELGDQVRRVLQEDDADWRASDRRIRRLAIDNDLVEVRVRTGTTGEQVREVCPVCEHDLQQVKNRTLKGDTTVVGTECPRCPYATGARHEVPLRYTFVREDGDDEPEHEGPF